MVLLTFTTKYEALIGLRKKQTIRANAEYWDKVATRMMDKLTKGKKEYFHIWWRNPRNKKKDCHKLGTAMLDSITYKKGIMFTLDDARRDGFGSVLELIYALGAANNILPEQVIEHRWAIIRFKWSKRIKHHFGIGFGD